jgi:hypothetical protein
VGATVLSIESMELHPAPSFAADCDLVIKDIPQNTQFFRIHSAKREAIYFSGLQPNQESRFCAVNQEYGTLYLAEDIFGAFRETVSRSIYQRVSEKNLISRCLSTVSANRDLRLADLTGQGLTIIGADARMTTDGYNHYQVSRQWAMALWKHSTAIDGLYYRSRYDPSKICIVLFGDRVFVDNLSEKRVNSTLLDIDFIPELIKVLDLYGYAIGNDNS